MNSDDIKEAVDGAKDSLKEFFDERFRTNFFYGTFILSWLVTNWQSWYITIFEKSETIGSKKDFLIKYFDDQGLCKLFLVPFGIAFLLIFLLPALGFVSRFAPDYFKALTNRIAKKIIWKIEVVNKEQLEEAVSQLRIKSSELFSANQRIVNLENMKSNNDKTINDLNGTIVNKDQIIKQKEIDFGHLTEKYKSVELLFSEQWTKITISNNLDFKEEYFVIEQGKFAKHENNKVLTYDLISHPQYNQQANNYIFSLKSNFSSEQIDYNLEIKNPFALIGTETIQNFNVDKTVKRVIFLRNRKSIGTQPDSSMIQVS